jgi:hypothetical protein
MREYIAKPPDPCTGEGDDAADHSAQIDLYQCRQAPASSGRITSDNLIGAGRFFPHAFLTRDT